MNFTVVFFVASALSVHALGISQTINYSGSDVKLEKIFSVIKEQTGYTVISSAKVLAAAKLVNINAKETKLADFLFQIMKDQPLDYEIENNTIIVSRKKLRPNSVPIRPTLTSPPVTGIIRGPDGSPLPGVNIVVKGTLRGTVTGADGSFNIEADAGNVLVISSIGYTTVSHTIKTLPIDISLGLSESKLDQVQIIAYGQTSQRLSTGNISTVKADDIANQPVSNPLLAIQGRTPGVFVEQSSGMPGSAARIRIQGQNSIGNGNAPLFIVDGVPYSSQTNLGNPENILGQLPDASNALNWINPGDIESIDILKDADATSIYGSRAANGAVLITTKKGKAGRTKASINMQTGIGEVTRKIKLLNTQQYLEMRKEAYENDGLPVPTEPSAFNYDLTVWDSTRYTDWQELLIGNTANYTNVGASASGGSASTQLLFGANYNREGTVMPGDHADRKISVNVNINHQSANKRFKLTFSGNYLAGKSNLPAADLTTAARELPPNAPTLYNPDGSLNWERIASGTDSISTFDNPLAHYSKSININVYNLISNAVLSYEILPKLQLRTNFGYTHQQLKELTLFPIRFAAPEAFNPRNTSKFGDDNTRSWIAEPQLSYYFNLPLGRLDLLAGATYSQTSINFQKIEGNGYASEALMQNIRAATEVLFHNWGGSDYKYVAAFGRINYNIQDKYILNFTARRDGSSRFGSENKFHNFASVGGAWLFSSEDFIRESLPFITFGKLKASFGTTGNDQISDYRYLNLYNPSVAPRLYQNIGGLSTFNLPNPYLQWELTKKLNIGLDLGFFDERLVISASWFRNRSSNQLLDYQLPFSTGFDGILSNFPATVQNAGVELSLNTTNIKRNGFSWSTSFNLTAAKNKLKSFPGLETSSLASRLIVGEPVLGLEKLFRFNGINPQTGSFEFIDRNGEITSDPGFGDENRIVVKNTNPRFYGGLQNEVTYGNFDLAFLFHFVKQYALSSLYAEPAGFAMRNQLAEYYDRWRKPGDDAFYQKTSATDFSNLLRSFYRGSSDAAYVDASFIRLKNVSIGYRFPKKWTSAAHLENGRIYVQGQNLLTITSFPALDPEARSISALPPLRVITAGIQVTF